MTQISQVSQVLQNSAADGRMSRSELRDLRQALDQSNLPQDEKDAIMRVADKMREFSKGGLFKRGCINPDEMAQLKAMEPGLQNSQFAREMLTLFDNKVQAEDNRSFFEVIGDFFKNLFGGSEAADATQSVDGQQSQNQTQSYQSSEMDPNGISFPSGSSNPDYPSVPEADPVASIPDYEPSYFAPANPQNPGEMYQRSPYHDDSKFVPAFAMTAFHESGVYRSAEDPYAVGAISRPSRRQDLGGKTYGAYQFESSVYADGSDSGRSRKAGSTLMRFVNSPNNPFGEQLRAAAQQYGIASPGFDEVWKRLAREHNKEFGEAQQQFMQQENAESVNSFMERAQLSPEVRNDPRIMDLVMGTRNQVASLANGVADFLAQKQSELGRQMTVEEVGVAITQYKKEHIGSWFRSSPEAQAGIRNRYNDEQAVFTA